LNGEHQGIEVGGPEILTYREIVQLAVQFLGKPAQITVVPVSFMKVVSAVMKIFNKQQGELVSFLTTAMTSEGVAPTTGTRSLRAYLAECGANAEGRAS
jgi:hypothetical protein